MNRIDEEAYKWAEKDCNLDLPRELYREAYMMGFRRAKAIYKQNPDVPVKIEVDDAVVERMKEQLRKMNEFAKLQPMQEGLRDDQ